MKEREGTKECLSPGNSVRFLLRINIPRNKYELLGSVNIKNKRHQMILNCSHSDTREFKPTVELVEVRLTMT